MSTITSVTDELFHADLPALFLDTCILLDIIRSVKRCHTNCVRDAIGFVDAATSIPIRCKIVASHIVSHEWAANEREIVLEASKHLSEMETQSAHFHEACAEMRIPLGFSRAAYSRHDVANRLRSLSHDLLKSAIIVDSDVECCSRAMGRVIQNIAPSRKGAEAKDCTIVEEYLAVCRSLQGQGFKQKLVLCTSNTRDYCSTGTKLHAALATDFSAVGLRFTANLSWAFHDVTT